jgi:acetyl esterase/lipase
MAVLRTTPFVEKTKIKRLLNFITLPDNHSDMTSTRKILIGLFSLSLLMTTIPHVQAQEPFTLALWPENVPGETKPKASDLISDDRSDGVTRIATVTNPVIEVFEPAGGNTTGLGMIVCPGGGYWILAIDLEGYEIARWLNQLGITAYVLHYRVPENREGALMDAQRAIRMVRHLFTEQKPYLKKIGIMGFSAGASLSARASTRYQERTYPPVDLIDSQSAKPDFAMLIYPAYLDEGKERSLTPELIVNSDTPPMFLFETADDPYGNSSLVMAGALRDQKVPVELHLLPTGGHGYGLRLGNPAAESWPDLAAKWLQKIDVQPTK